MLWAGLLIRLPRSAGRSARSAGWRVALTNAMGRITDRLGCLLPAQARRAFAAGAPVAGRSRAANSATRPDRAARRAGGHADILDRSPPGAGRARRGTGSGRDRGRFESAVPGRRRIGRHNGRPLALDLGTYRSE